ncbi:MAG: LTA synthase family protein [Lachnospiraceae bacterium]|nr:LTA synthase family protein [Lachnospiraceae bacterium]
MNISNKFKEKGRGLLSFFLLLIIPIVIFYLMEFFTHNPFKTMAPAIQFLNILFFELVMVLGLFIFKRARIALWVEAVVFALVGLANYFVLNFRSAPIMPWDILSIKTAASVADNYSYRLDQQAITVLLLFIPVLAASYFCDISVTSIKTRLSGALISLILLTSFVNYTQTTDCLYRFRLYDKLFTPTTMTYKDGTVVAFCMQLQYIFVEKPEGYSAEKAINLLKETSQKVDKASKDNNIGEAHTGTTDTPNIIVIMNEAFSDLDILGEFTTNEDYIPFVHSLLEGAENTQSGYLGVSVLGGNTANTEFEFLTGQTMAFLPQGSIPYQQYIKNETFSLASWLKELGYSTAAIHPYGATGWQRHQVYPWLGFTDFLALDDFSGAKKIRKYVSDEADYEKIIQLYENKEDGQPLFIFNVTMQNHSSYTDAFDNFTPDITIKGSKSFALSQYLSLLKVSDQEIEELVHYFSQQEEETILLFFGDHQPTDSVVRDIWRLNGKNDQALSREELNLRYRVPFFLWANYDIEEKTDISTSPNYLGLLLLEAADLPLSSFHQFLDELQQSYPLISSIEVQDNEGNSRDVKEVQDKLTDYAILQYYYLMEKGEALEE